MSSGRAHARAAAARRAAAPAGPPAGRVTRVHEDSTKPGVGCGLRRLWVALAAIASLLAVLAVGSSSASASSSCPNEALRNGPSASLPDCRAYELVSPENKNGGNVDGGVAAETEPPPQQAAPNGESITYASQVSFTEADPLSAQPNNQYMSVRGPEGWTTIALDPPTVLPFGEYRLEQGSLSLALFQGFNEDLTYAYVDHYEPVLAPGAPLHYFSPYLRNNTSGTYALLSTVTPPVQAPYEASNFKGFTPYYAGMSANGKYVIFEANDALTPEAAPGKGNLYEWANGHLELVSIFPNGETDAGGDEAVRSLNALPPKFGGELTYHENGDVVDVTDAISKDGLRAFWTGSDYQIYMHEITPAGPRTVEVSASQKTNAGSQYDTRENALYWGSSADGSLVYFSSCEQLTNESTAHFSEECSASEGHDLYQYDANTGVLTDLTVDHNAEDTQGASVLGVLGISEDGSYVYFAATGNLAEGVPMAEENRRRSNIYVWHDGVTKFIAAVSGPEQNWISDTHEHLSRVSPNGLYLAFQAAEELTGQTTRSSSSTGCATRNNNEGEHGRCQEMYLYDAETGALACASCSPQGVPPNGNSLSPPSVTTFGAASGWQSPTQQQHYLLNDGRLFFVSENTALLPEAGAIEKYEGTEEEENNQLDLRYDRNVFEYEPSGVGTCRGAHACLYLISSPGAGPSQFVDASENGNDVFFTTRSQLVPQDGDDAVDMYDARVDGGFSPLAQPPCGGEACRPAIVPAPSIYGAPPSETYAGQGNVPGEAPAQAVKQKTVKKSKAKHKQKQKQAKRGGRKRRGAPRGATKRRGR